MCINIFTLTHGGETENMHQKWFKTFYLVASNLAFLFPGLFALASNYYVQACIYASITVFSSLYHLCKEDWIDAAGDGGYCFILSFDQFKAYDFFFAQMIVPITFFYFLSFDAIVDVNASKLVAGDRKWMETLLLYWFGFFNAFMIVGGNEFFRGAAVLTVSALLTILFKTIIIYIKYDGLFPRFYTTELVLGLLFSCVAVSFMYIQDHVSNQLYWFIHASWHILGSIGQFFLIISKREVTSRRHYYNETRPLSLIDGDDNCRHTVHTDCCRCRYAFYSDPAQSERRFSRLPYNSVFQNKLKNLCNLCSWTTPKCK